MERECIEETCDYEECYEIVDEKTVGSLLWKLLTECKAQRQS